MNGGKGLGGGVWGRGENRKLSVMGSSPAMSSQELMTSGGSKRRDLGSESGLGKSEPRVNRGGGVVWESEGGGGSRDKRP